MGWRGRGMEKKKRVLEEGGWYKEKGRIQE